jgi:predicted Na+-dependent transporter
MELYFSDISLYVMNKNIKTEEVPIMKRIFAVVLFPVLISILLNACVGYLLD